MIVRFQGSDEAFELEGYPFSKPKCYVCERDEDAFGRTLDLHFCEEMRVFWCRNHTSILNEEHPDTKISKCYNGHGWQHLCLSGVDNASTE
jgi:hypothetical protein